MNASSARRGALRALPPTAWAPIAATLLIAHQVAGKATRDAVFLLHYDVTDLPKAVLAAAVVSMLSVVLITRLLARHGPVLVITAAFVLSAAGFVLQWLCSPYYPRAVAAALYLQMAIFGAVLISGFWSVVNERFDPYTARQTIARIGAAAALGGVLGGLLAGEVARTLDVQAMLLVLAVLHGACAIAVRGIGANPRAAAATMSDHGIVAGFRQLFTNRYLNGMGIAMVMVASLGALLDYGLKSFASISFARGDELVAFFGEFYATVGVTTFLVQSLFGQPLLRRFGLGTTLVLMPAVTCICGVIAVIAPRLATLVVLRGAQLSLGNSFFRAAFELLYTPLPPVVKRSTKTIIDVASDRLGDMLGSGLLLVMLAVSPESPPRVVAALGLLFAAGIVLVALRLHRGYVEQLATSLRAGAIRFDDTSALDATTRHTLAEASGTAERALLMRRIREMKYARLGVRSVSPAPATSNRDVGYEPHAAQLTQAAADLVSGDRARITRCLHGGFMDVRLAPLLLPLLADDGLAEDVRMELRWMSPRIIGLLSDALGSPDLPCTARQRLPSVLEVVHSTRAVAVLMDGLDDEEFTVRYSCARALVRMCARDDRLVVEPARVLAAVEREVTVDQATWEAQDATLDVDLPLDSVGGLDVPPPLDHSMAHVFTLLGLVFDRAALASAQLAVAAGDPALSGTALEYLENVLPEDVRVALWPRLQTAAARAPLSPASGDRF